MPFSPRCLRLLLPAALIAAAGCASQHKVLIAPQLRQEPPQQVAVLLMENDALDLNAPDMLRTLAYQRLRAKGYNGPPLATVDAKLRGIGITDGGQLKSLKAQDIGAAVETDGLLFGEIETFSNTDLGYVMRKVVKVKLTLVDAVSGATLWDDEESASQSAIRTDTKQAEQAALFSLGEKAVSNMLKKPLYPQSVQCMDELFATLPPRGGPQRPLRPQPPGPPPGPPPFATQPPPPSVSGPTATQVPIPPSAPQGNPPPPPGAQ